LQLIYFKLGKASFKSESKVNLSQKPSSEPVNIQSVLPRFVNKGGPAKELYAQNV
jgi:hypothetical protein